MGTPTCSGSASTGAPASELGQELGRLEPRAHPTDVPQPEGDPDAEPPGALLDPHLVEEALPPERLGLLDGAVDDRRLLRAGQRFLVGDRAPHAWIVVEGRRLSTIDLFDGTLTLLTGASGWAWRSAAGALPADLPLQLLAVDTEVSDPTGELTKRYGLTGDGAVLVRPDGYVAWIGQATEDDAVEVLRTAVSRSLGGVPDHLSDLGVPERVGAGRVDEVHALVG